MAMNIRVCLYVSKHISKKKIYFHPLLNMQQGEWLDPQVIKGKPVLK